MKRSISFCWLDFIGLGKQAWLIISYPILLLFLAQGSIIMPIWTMVFVMSTFLAMPFQVTRPRQNRKLQFVLPAKVEQVVAGRFFYLFFVFLYSWGVTLAALWLIISEAQRQEMIQDYGILILIVILLSLAVSCIQYMIFYRFTFTSPQLASIVTMLPNIVISLIFVKVSDEIERISSILQYITNHSLESIVILLVAVVGLGLISYLVCVRICKRQDF